MGVLNFNDIIDSAVPKKRMKISKQGIRFIKSFEGLFLEAYLCPADVLTIGYGKTGPDVKPDMVITAEEAHQMLLDELVQFEKGVSGRAVVPLQQCQFDALVSFSFNVGLGALAASTLLLKLNSKDYSGASEEFLRWNKHRKKGQLRVSKGLSRRRAAEKQMFTGDGYDYN